MPQHFTADEVERIHAGLDRLYRFVGYGNPRADVWFLGIEERGDDWSLLARLGFDAIEDCATAHVEKLGVTHHHAVDLSDIRLQPTWATMCHVMLQLGGAPPTPHAKKVYQARKLGRRIGGETFLVELLPLPNPYATDAAWSYGHLGIPELADRRTYLHHVQPNRERMIRALIAEHRPKVVVVYGSGPWWRNLFADITFEIRDECFHVGRLDQTLVVHSPHFAYRFSACAMTSDRNRDRLAQLVMTESHKVGLR